MNKKNPKLRKMKMQKRVTQIEGGRYLIYYSFKNELLVNELTMRCRQWRPVPRTDAPRQFS